MVSIGHRSREDIKGARNLYVSFSKVEPTSGIVEPNQQQTMTLTFRRGWLGCGVLKRCNFPPHFFLADFWIGSSIASEIWRFLLFLSKILWALVFSGFQNWVPIGFSNSRRATVFYLKLATVTLMESNVTCRGFFRTRCFKIFANRLESEFAACHMCVLPGGKLLGKSLGRDSDISACQLSAGLATSSQLTNRRFCVEAQLLYHPGNYTTYPTFKEGTSSTQKCRLLGDLCSSSGWYL